MNDQDHEVFEESDADHKVLALIEAIVLEQHHGPSKHLCGIGEVEPMLR